MAPGARPYLPLLDPLRLLASVAVVRHHMREDYLFGVGFGLPLFLLILLALGASSARAEPLPAFARRKADFLLRPWVRWSLIYVALGVAADAARGIPPLGRLEASMLIEGGNPMLWFLPFALVALLVLKGVRRSTARLAPSRAVVVWSVVGVAVTIAVAGALTGEPPLRGWVRVAPALPWGLALAASLRAPSGAERRRGLAVVATLAVATYWLTPWRDHAEDLPRRFAVAVPLACAGMAWRVPVPRAVRFVAGTTFGVYLVHPLVAKVLVAVADPFAWPAAVHVGVVWGVAALVVLAVRRSPLAWHECDAPARRAAGRDASPPAVEGRPVPTL